MPYQKPLQDRARRTEQRFLDALTALLDSHGFQATTVERIADQAGLTRGAFMKRFGSKKGALLLLFSQYADRASALMQTYVSTLDDHPNLTSLFLDMSQRFESLLTENFAVNRAMDELFRATHEWQDRTAEIHFECVDMMAHIQRHFISPDYSDPQAARNSAQLLITINFNYVMNAMRSLPPDPLERHRVIADILAMLLTRPTDKR